MSFNCKTSRIVNDESGYVLGLVMIFFVVFTILGLAFIKMQGFERLHVFNYDQKSQAFYYADGGIHKGVWLLNTVSKAAATFSDATVTVVYDSVTMEFVSTGISGGALDSIKVSVVEDGIFKISSWEEL